MPFGKAPLHDNKMAFRLVRSYNLEKSQQEWKALFNLLFLLRYIMESTGAFSDSKGHG